MKRLSNKFNLISIFNLILLTFSQVILFAQDSTGAASSAVQKTVTTETTWYAQPWAWIAGITLIIVLIFLLSAGKGRKENITITKTVREE